MKKFLTLLGILLITITPASARLVGYTEQVFRLYNPETNQHLYTTDRNEGNTLIGQGIWIQDMSGWFTLTDVGDPIYRIYNPQSDEHLYTMDKNEIATLTANGWIQDFGGEPIMHSGGPENIYRLFNQKTGQHLLTCDESEYNILGSQDWNKEGVAFTGAYLYSYDYPQNHDLLYSDASYYALFTDGKGNYKLEYDFLEEAIFPKH